MSNDYQPPTFTKLEENELWKEVCDLAEHIYSKLDEFTEEEKWHTETKLRSSANNLMFDVSQAAANINLPGTGAEFDWRNARRQAYTLKTMYRFAGRQKFIELEPEVMVRLDKIIKQIDKEFEKAHRQTFEYNKKEFELWQKRYDLWKNASVEEIKKTKQKDSK